MRDAQEYASRIGVSVEEAVSRLKLQDEIGELNAVLAKKERDTFAGLWVEHSPKYRVIARFTRHGESIIQPYIENGPLAELVEVRPASVSLAVLREQLAQTRTALNGLDFDVNATLNVQENRIEIFVTDPDWFEGELQKANIVLPEHVVLVPVEGPSAAEVDVCTVSPADVAAFPRQAPVEGIRAVMEAELIGDLTLAEGCLRVTSIFGGGSPLPVWPADFRLQAEDDAIKVLDGSGEVVAVVGEEVYMSGGIGSQKAMPACVQEQLPASCTGPYWVVGNEVRPNLKRDSDLFSLDVISTTGRTLLFLHKKPVLDEWAPGVSTLGGTLVWYEWERCLRLATETNPAGYLLLWPTDFEARAGEDGIEILDGSGNIIAQSDEQVALRGNEIPVSWELDSYRQLLSELPRDCLGPYWIVSAGRD